MLMAASNKSSESCGEDPAPSSISPEIHNPVLRAKFPIELVHSTGILSIISAPKEVRAVDG
jgi:hypothetical protein